MSEAVDAAIARGMVVARRIEAAREKLHEALSELWDCGNGNDGMMAAAAGACLRVQQEKAPPKRG